VATGGLQVVRVLKKGKGKTILILHRGHDQIRGTEACLIELVSVLAEHNYRIIMLRNNRCIDGAIIDNVDQILDESFPEIMFDPPQRTFPLFRYVNALVRLFRLARKYRPSLFLASGGLPCQLAVPVGKLLHIPILCHFHHPAPRRYLYLWFVRYATNLMFPSEFTRSLVMEQCGRDGTVIYNAVDVHRRFVPVDRRDYEYRRALGISAAKIVIGQVGNLSAHKRPDVLMRCFAQALTMNSDIHLLLVGYGPMYGDLERLATELGVAQSVNLPGFVPDVLPFYQHVIDINVLASREEGLGISVIEAGACGLPSVVTDCTGLREVVANNDTGLTFDVDDPDQLVD